MMLWIAFVLIGLYHGVNTQCTVRGRFPNDITEDCRGYTTCIATTSSSFYQYDLACPPNFIYNHLDNQCTNATGYRCLSSYNCTILGDFPNENSTDCTSYISCIQGLTSLSARLVDCPPNTVFNRNDAFCVEDTVYTCPTATTTTNKPEVPVTTLFSNHNVTSNVTDPTHKQGNNAPNTKVPLIGVISCFIMFCILN